MTKKNGDFTYQDGVDFQKHYDTVICNLKELLLDKIANLVIQMHVEKLSVEAARQIALQVSKEHFENLNEAAKTLKDFKATYVAQIWLDPKLEGYERRISDLETNKKVVEGKASITLVYVNFIFLIIALTISVLSYFK